MGISFFVREKAKRVFKEFREHYQKVVDELSGEELIGSPQIEMGPWPIVIAFYHPVGVIEVAAGVVYVWRKAPKIGKPVADWIIYHEFYHHLYVSKLVEEAPMAAHLAEQEARLFAWKKTGVSYKKFVELSGKADEIIIDNFVEWRKKWRK